MGFYIRKISPAKWPQKGKRVDVDCVRADAITSDIRTTEDTISVWKIDAIEDLNQAVLALASGGDKAVTYNVLSIPEESMQRYGFELKETDGNTPVEELKGTHRDVINVTYAGLGKFAQMIMDSVDAEQMHTITKKTVKRLIVDAYKDGKIDKDKLKDRMREEIEEALRKEA